MPVVPRLARSRTALWLSFVLVHALLVLLGLYGPNTPLGDVTLVYTAWSESAFRGYLVGVDGPWVYPIVAIVPMLAAGVFGGSGYLYSWLVLVVLLNATAFAVLTGVGRGPAKRHRAAWWWLAFLALLGPIAVGRIDAVTVPVAIVAVLVAPGRPRLASVLLAVATWVKVWPAAVLAALVISSRARTRIVMAAIATSALIVAVALLAGSGWNVLSFITEQTGRGLQIEAPVATIWMWQAAAGVPDAWVYYDRDILTYQVAGAGTELASAIMTPLLVLMTATVAAIGVRSTLRGAPFVALFPPLALALVLTFMVVNKVGSPQFLCWLAAPVIVGLVFRGRRYRTPAILALLLAGLTQLIYPFLYDGLLVADPFTVALLTLRNLLEVALLAWAVVAVWQSAPLPAARPQWKSGRAPHGAVH